MTNKVENVLFKIIFRRMQSFCYSTTTAATPPASEEEFKPLNIWQVRQTATKKFIKKETPVLPNRADQMPVDQDWGNVWPGPRSFQPATVPLPLYQGYATKTDFIPGKYANAELMKIPNFLHLTPPVIKRQCDAMKRFCTTWPEALTDKMLSKHFPIEVITSTYCSSSPTIRNPLARIVSIKLPVESLKLDTHAQDKFCRLVRERYNEKTNICTIVVDRCPTKKQNYDYSMYLITALYHESNKVEPWESLKTDEDMAVYTPKTRACKDTIELIFGKPIEEVPNQKEYMDLVDKYYNEGESEEIIEAYEQTTRTLLSIPRQIL